MIRYLQLETAAISFSSKPLSKTGYWLGDDHLILREGQAFLVGTDYSFSSRARSENLFSAKPRTEYLFSTVTNF